MSRLKFNFKIDKENKAGLYITISFHLILLIIFLCYSIHSVKKSETSFVLDFTKQEAIEKEEKIAQMKESVSKELDELIAQARSQAPRNVVVDAGAKLKDDRNGKNSDIMEEAKELQDKLDASKRAAEAEQGSDDDVSPSSPSKEEKKAAPYKGPSVISYRLDGRKSMSLPIPAYKCIGAGDVTVIIVVNRKGYVTGAKIAENISSKDNCLQEYAIKAAKRSRFNAVSSGDDRQVGEILYRFVAQ